MNYAKRKALKNGEIKETKKNLTKKKHTDTHKTLMQIHNNAIVVISRLYGVDEDHRKKQICLPPLFRRGRAESQS